MSTLSPSRSACCTGAGPPEQPTAHIVAAANVKETRRNLIILARSRSRCTRPDCPTRVRPSSARDRHFGRYPSRSERSTQNSFPSGSARTIHEGWPCPTSARVAPNDISRATSPSRSSGRRSRWSRFFPDFSSGTGANKRPGKRSGADRISNSSGASFTTTHPSACAHHLPNETGSRASTFNCSHFSTRPSCPVRRPPR